MNYKIQTNLYNENNIDNNIDEELFPALKVHKEDVVFMESKALKQV